MTTFILVHGTFARAATWPALEAAVNETALAAKDTANFVRFEWTGKNRAQDRRNAATALLSTIRAIKAMSPNEKIFAIGHSHGGSAIAYLIKEHPSILTMVTGFAFLSTPFFAIRPRRQARELFVFLSYITLICVLALWSHFNLPENMRPSMDMFISRMPAQYWIGVTLVAIAFLLFVKASKRIFRAEAITEELIRQQTADLPHGNYLFLRCSGDEAAAALSTAQFVVLTATRLCHLLERFLSAPKDFISVCHRIIVAGIMPVMIGASLLRLTEVQKVGVLQFTRDRLAAEEYWSSLDTFLLILIGLGIPAVFLFGLTIAFLTLITQAVMSRGFGWTKLSTGFLVDLAIEPLPFGQHQLVHVDWNTDLDGIVHSWTYAHPTAVEKIKEWIELSLSDKSDNVAACGAT